MRVYIWFLLCIFSDYVNYSENFKILGKLHDFFHPTKPPTTLSPVVPTFGNIGSSEHEDSRITENPSPGNGVSEYFDSTLKDGISSNKYSNNDFYVENTTPSTPSQIPSHKLENNINEPVNISPKNSGSGPVVGPTSPKYNDGFNNVNSKEPQTSINLSEKGYTRNPQNNIDSFENEISSYDSTTEPNLRYVTNNKTSPMNSNSKEPMGSSFNQHQPTYSSNNFKPVTIESGEHQPSIDSKKTNNQPYPTIGDSEKSNKNTGIDKNNQIQPTFGDNESDQGQGTTIGYEEGGPIVFPTETETDSNPKWQYGQNDTRKNGYDYSDPTTRTAKANSPVPVDGGRVVIDAPPKNCGPGRKADDRGICRDEARLVNLIVK